MGLSLLIDWKKNNYDTVLVVVNFLSKMMYYKSIKTIIDIVGIAKIIIDIVIRHHGLPESITSD